MVQIPDRRPPIEAWLEGLSSGMEIRNAKHTVRWLIAHIQRLEGEQQPQIQHVPESAWLEKLRAVLSVRCGGRRHDAPGTPKILCEECGNGIETLIRMMSKAPEPAVGPPSVEPGVPSG